MITFDNLTDLLRVERESDALQYIEPSIEKDILTYLNGLINEQNTCDNYRDLSMLRDEYKSAMVIIESVAERRFAKMVNLAILSVNRQTDAKLNISEADQKIFNSICNELKQLKNNMQLSKCMVIT
jgi:DNA replication initiation complex subunit (GINS family)